MSQMADDLLANGGWRERYNWYQNNWDLMPMFVPSPWREFDDMSKGAATQLSIQFARDIWVYRLTLHCVVRMGENVGGDMVVQPPLYLQYRVKVNGNPISGWVDAYLREGGFDQVGLGPGFHLGKARGISVEVRRAVELTSGAEGFQNYQLQLVAEGSELMPKGSNFYADGMRNMIAEEWDEQAELEPMWYGDIGELDLSTAGNRITLQNEVDASPFLLDRIWIYQYPDGPVNNFTIPLYSIPKDAECEIDNRPIYDRTSIPACDAYGGDPLFTSRKFRIPLLIAPRAKLFCRPGGWPWEQAKTVEVGVLWAGMKIIAFPKTQS